VEREAAARDITTVGSTAGPFLRPYLAAADLDDAAMAEVEVVAAAAGGGGRRPRRPLRRLVFADAAGVRHVQRRYRRVQTCKYLNSLARIEGYEKWVDVRVNLSKKKDE
jgi:hypothetical protein